jgi:DNA-binding Lrp family transcriptional regulator
MEAYVLVKIATQTDVCGFSRSVAEKISKMKGVVNAHLLFSLKPAKRKEFLQNVRKIGGVEESRLVLGNWDAIAKVEADNIQELEKVYFNQIDKLPSINYSRLYIMACPRTRK